MVSSSLLLALLPAVAAGPVACKAAKQTACKVTAGNFTIKAKSLYPENADFDPSRCVTYISNLYNNTVSVYNATENRITNVIAFDCITNVDVFHTSGLQRDVKHDMLTISANAGAAFDSNGKDISGSNMLLQYNLTSGELAWEKDLTETTKGVYGGFQDMEHDAEGNIFVIGSYPSSILKVSADGETVEEWYVSERKEEEVKPHGYTGIARLDNKTALVTDGETGQLLKFDLTAARGDGKVVDIGGVRIGTDLDGAYLPPMYNNTVLLASDSGEGTVVLRSKDGWESAQRLDLIRMPEAIKADGGFAVATVQIADRIYGVTEYFGDNNATAGKYLTREDYTWYDMTDDIQNLLV